MGIVLISYALSCMVVCDAPHSHTIYLLPLLPPPQFRPSVIPRRHRRQLPPVANFNVLSPHPARCCRRPLSSPSSPIAAIVHQSEIWHPRPLSPRTHAHIISPLIIGSSFRPVSNRPRRPRRSTPSRLVRPPRWSNSDDRGPPATARDS